MNDGRIKQIRAGGWVHTLDMLTGEQGWEWSGQLQNDQRNLFAEEVRGGRVRRFRSE